MRHDGRMTELVPAELVHYAVADRVATITLDSPHNRNSLSRQLVTELFAGMPIENHSFSTSGDYERGFVKDGVRYHHILDPRTGQPAHASRSVTIRAKDAFTADAWSKVMFILGPQEALKVIQREKLEDFEVIWVDDQNQVVVTDTIKSALILQRKPTPGI